LPRGAGHLRRHRHRRRERRLVEPDHLDLQPRRTPRHRRVPRHILPLRGRARDHHPRDRRERPRRSGPHHRQRRPCPAGVDPGPTQPPPLATPPTRPAAEPPPGAPVTLTATATDDFDGDLGAQVRWTSNRDGVLGTGTGATRTLILTEGVHTLTAAVTDSDGA